MTKEYTGDTLVEDIQDIHGVVVVVVAVLSSMMGSLDRLRYLSMCQIMSQSSLTMKGGGRGLSVGERGQGVLSSSNSHSWFCFGRMYLLISDKYCDLL